MAKKRGKIRNLGYSLYSNLASKKPIKNNKRLKNNAQPTKRYTKYLETMPKSRGKKILHRLNPKYWFSKTTPTTIIKALGIIILIIALLIGGLFIYFRKDLEAISPGEISKKVQTTVNTYLDRNGKVLWEDKGTGNYKLVVEDDEITEYLKQATVAIEDKEFYMHGGVSLSGIIRAFINNVIGGRTQGGSTLTQQLVKQVFFSEEASSRGLSGIPRKIKEAFLAIEVERMYSKNQILDLYLNESPYGGRRNGVASASQTYFGKSPKDLSIAEAALLASIPQNPSYYNPYNTVGNESLISRQHTVINYMHEQGYISKEEADKAKEYPILDNIIPESSQYDDIRAPHFVQMARSEAIQKIGENTIGNGGLTITTSLDLDIQNKLEESMNELFASYWPDAAGFSNGASTVEDNVTGQIVALMGSRDFNHPGFGQDNAATAYIQPGSTIKSLVYAELFENKGNGQQNFGSGTMLSDENIDAIYGAKLNNADRTFWGNISIRTALANSRNIPAVKAMYISGVKPTLDKIHAMGGKSYCTQGAETGVGLAAAIGGCGIKQVDLVNAYASLARGGIYKDQTTLLEIKDASGQSLYKYQDSVGKQVLDAQSAYIVSDILSDDNARSRLVGTNLAGFVIDGVKTATKTGTSDTGGNSKDIWMMSYSPVLTMSVWLGNNDTSILRNGNSTIPRTVVNSVMSYAHKEVYTANGKWKSGDWISKPSGIQTVNNELYPSWWNKTQSQSTEQMMFDKVSKKKATNLTPDGAKIELTVTKIIDPVTKKPVYSAPDGYDANADDDAHKSTDNQAIVSVITEDNGDNKYTVTVTLTPGTFNVTNIQIKVGGSTVTSLPANSSNTYIYKGTLTPADTSRQTVTATVTDSGYYVNDHTSQQTTPVYQSL